MRTKSDPDLGRDAILSAEEADAALAAWTLDELDPEELPSERWASDEPGA
jgi:hypothetical protein